MTTQGAQPVVQPANEDSTTVDQAGVTALVAYLLEMYERRRAARVAAESR